MENNEQPEEEWIEKAAKKPRGDMRMAKLSAKDQEDVFAHCSKFTLKLGVVWLLETYKVTLCRSSLGRWLSQRRLHENAPEALEKLRYTRDFVRLIQRVFKSATGITTANSVIMAQAVFEELAKPEKKRNEERLTSYMQLALKARDQELKETAIALGNDKFKASLRTKLEAGLDALAERIQENDAAMEKYRELKEELAKAA